MIKVVSLAALATAFGLSVAQACPQHCGEAVPGGQQQPLVEVDVPVLPPHYIVEMGPIYDGLGVHARPRVYKPRHATFMPAYIYGYGVGFSRGPVVLASYPYVRRMHRHRAPLRVYY